MDWLIGLIGFAAFVVGGGLMYIAGKVPVGSNNIEQMVEDQKFVDQIYSIGIPMLFVGALLVGCVAERLL